ncbi:MAG TPA: carboxypeptidase regulatory-like domain-containing protein [Polyangiales bacterium]
MKRYATLILIASMTAACAGQVPPAASAASAGTPEPTAPAPGAPAEVVAPAGQQPTVAPAAAQPAAAQPATATQPTAAAAASPGALGTLHGTITSTPAGAAKSAVLYLEDGPVAQPVNGAVSNKQMSFSPYISVITTGAKVTFTNNDPFPHNIFTPDHEKWDLGQLEQHGTKTKTFAKPGAYALLCNLHPNMKAYVLVVPSSYFVKSDSKGNFTLKDVPAGTYKVSVWAPGVATSTQTVSVGADTSANFELHR